MSTDSSQSTGTEKIRRNARKVLIAILAVWAVILIGVQVLLSPKALTNIVNKFAANYVEGDISFGRISVSVLRSFPRLNLKVEDFSITYPHDRFASYDSVGIRSQIAHFGRSEAADTLASFRSLSASLNYMALLRGRVNVPSANLDNARVFAAQYDSTTFNWDMFKIASEEEDDDETFTIPPVKIGGLSISGHPMVFYKNPTDTIFATAYMDDVALSGRFATGNVNKNKMKLDVDNLFAALRLPSDTLSFNLSKLEIFEHKDHMDIDADSELYIATNSFGRITLPIGLSGELMFPPSEGIAVQAKEVELSLASVKIEGEADINVLDDIYIRADLKSDNNSVQDAFNFFRDNFPILGDLTTDAKLSVGIDCDGWYRTSTGDLPDLKAYVKIPQSTVRYSGIDRDGEICLDFMAGTDNGRLNASIDRLDIDFAGIDLDLDAKARDLLGDDPLFTLNGDGSAELAEIFKLMPEDMGISAEGHLQATLGGDILLSQMSPYYFSEADLKASLWSDMITVDDPSDSISAVIHKPSLTMDKGLTVKVDSLLADAMGMVIGGTDAQFFVKNAVAQMSDTPETRPFMGDLDVASINVKLDDATTLGIRETCDIFTMQRVKKGNVFTPILNFTTDNRSLFMHSGVNRVSLKDANFHVRAAMHSFEKNQIRKQRLDSLMKVYPGVPKDELLERERAKRRNADDFSDRDMDFRLDEAIAQYYKEWDLSGELDIKEGLMITPYFPLKNELRAIYGSFTNDEVKLRNMTVLTGESDLSATGTLSGLRRALLGNAPIDVKLDISSESINANELIAAYDLGMKYEERAADSAMKELDDETYLGQVTSEDLSDSDAELSLIVVPSNIRANLSLQCNSIKYSDLHINWLAADLVMKQRTIQLTNTLATSNMGDIYFEGFYTTRAKDDIAAGFDLTMSDISADQVINLMPAVDTIMPMIKAFKGMLDCEMAVTSQLDTNMNLIMPTVNGIIKIDGEELSLEETGPIKTLAKLLMFRNKKTGYIDDMKVNGIINNNKLEVFPFVLKIDRYNLAMSGIQDLSNDFKYHISVLRSPIPFRFGINITGNFDDWKWRIGRAKYKSTNVPVFTAQVDSLKINLVNSIHNIFTKGVARVLAENEASQAAIEAKKLEIGYNSEEPMDSLDLAEMAQLDSLQREYELAPTDSLLNARIDSLSAVAAAREAAGVTIEDNIDEKLQQIMDEKFQKMEIKEQQKLNKKQQRQARRKARKARRAQRKAERLERRESRKSQEQKPSALAIIDKDKTLYLNG